jgi:hypothetical protein
MPVYPGARPFAPPPLQEPHRYYEPVRQHAAQPGLRPGSPDHQPCLGMSRRAFSRSIQERQAGLTSPPCRTPPGQSARTRQAHPGTRNIAPVSMPAVFVTTRQQRFACARLPDPYLTHPVRLFLDRSPRRSSANAARGGLEPPRAGRLRRAFLHLLNSTISNSPGYLIRTPFDVRDTRPGKVAILSVLRV